MKHFVISLILLASLITLVTFNANKVAEKVSHLSLLVSSLPDEPDIVKADEIKKYWDDCRDFLSMSLNTSELERAEEYISELCSSSDKNAYALAKEKLKNTLGSLDDGEKIGFYTIF